jgi:hypothetical protein
MRLRITLFLQVKRSVSITQSLQGGKGERMYEYQRPYSKTGFARVKISSPPQKKIRCSKLFCMVLKCTSLPQRREIERDER